MTTIMTDLYPVLKAVFGWSTEVTQAEYKDSEKKMKEHLKTISGALAGKYICGDDITVADFVIAGPLALCFQTIFDAGFCKAPINQKGAAWFKAVSEHPSFVRVNGKVHMCARALKPIVKVEVKEKKVQAVAVKKDEVKEEAPDAKLKALPKSDFDLFNYKTFFCNEKDKAGSAMDKTMEMFKSEGFAEGYSFWHMKYQRYGQEGTVLYKFVNLMNGFLQRMDTKFGQYSFGRVVMLGEEPNLEIEAVFMFRGQEVPFQMTEHVSYEYFDTKKLDFMNNDDDNKCVREFMGVKEGSTIRGGRVEQFEWWK